MACKAPTDNARDALDPDAFTPHARERTLAAACGLTQRAPRPRHSLFESAPLWLSGLLALGSIREVRAADDDISYKFQSYQEDDDRIKVLAHYGRVQKELGDSTRIAVQGVVDTITGATPSGEPAPVGSDQVPLSTVHKEIRRGVLVELSHTFARHELSGQFSYSGESDYISRGFALTDLVNFNQKNTVLQLGYARADDEVHPVFFTDSLPKTSDDFIVGVTQILSPRTTLSVNVGLGLTRGYISDPYKIIEKDTELFPGLFLPLTFPENRPDDRKKVTLFASLSHYVDSMRGSVEMSFRYFDDDWGIASETFQFAWFQKLGDRFVLSPSLRIYNQSAADFYLLSLNGTSIVPTDIATGMAPYYSADYRLSEFRAITAGLKLVARLGEHLSVDVAFERYEMRGRDGITPQSAFASANVVNIGAQWSF